MPPVAADKIAIFGATSDIAVAFARVAAPRGSSLFLAGRDETALANLAADLTVRGAGTVVTHVADFGRLDALADHAAAARVALGTIDIALIAYGTLPDQQQAESDLAAAQEALTMNFTSPALLANALAGILAEQGRGTLAVITSVAGDRGRRSNYVYGAAKAGLQRFLEGLRHRLATSHVTILDIRPGFVMTKMTAHLARGGPLWAAPGKVAADIRRAVDRHAAVVYTPWFWAGIMMIVRMLPRPLFHRTRL